MHVFLILIAMGLFWALFAWIPTYFLWNWLMPTLFGLPEVTLFQALGLIILSSLLLKSSISVKQYDFDRN